MQGVTNQIVISQLGHRRLRLQKNQKCELRRFQLFSELGFWASENRWASLRTPTKSWLSRKLKGQGGRWIPEINQDFGGTGSELQVKSYKLKTPCAWPKKRRKGSCTMLQHSNRTENWVCPHEYCQMNVNNVQQQHEVRILDALIFPCCDF